MMAKLVSFALCQPAKHGGGTWGCPVVADSQRITRGGQPSPGSRTSLQTSGRPLPGYQARGAATLQPILSGLPPPFQLCIQVPQRRELPRECRGSRWLGFSPRIEIAAPEQVGRGNHGRAHGTILVGPLGPSQFLVQPKIKAHRPYLTALPMSWFASSTSWFGLKGFCSIAQSRKQRASSGSAPPPHQSSHRLLRPGKQWRRQLNTRL